MDWRDTLIDTLVRMGSEKGIVPFDQEKVLDFMNELADLERGKTENKRVGFAYALDNYEPKGLMSILKRAKELWPDEVPPPIPVEQKPEGSVHKLECVVSVKLNSECDPGDLATKINNYLVECFDYFDAIVVCAMQNHDKWYDILVRYSARLSKIYEFLRQVPWIDNIITKPKRDFGKRTIATFAK